MLPAFSPEEIDQLQRAAQMFEMILDSGAHSDEAYETLKDVYTKLRMPEEYKRVTARFAEFLLGCDNRDAGIAQLTELAERYPDESQWRERLDELNRPVVSDGPAIEPRTERPLVERDDVAAFNTLKAAAEQQAMRVLHDSNGEDLERAIREAETLLAELDPGLAGPMPEDAPRIRPARTEANRPEPAPVLAATTGDRASARHVAAKLQTHATADVSREIQRSLRLGEMLVEQGVITHENLETALEKQKSTGRLIGDILIELGYAAETDVLHCLQVQAGVPYLPLDLYDVQTEVAALLPAAFAHKHRLVAVDIIANSVLVTIAAPLSRETKAELESLLNGKRVSYYISAQSEVDKKIEELYPHR
ncbi:MAG: hypothetical protein JW889_00320 [Verrucomicrobia bacterium]|nr:hypothetical protein [Verrucomicrobiota bacterium]